MRPYWRKSVTLLSRSSFRDERKKPELNSLWPSDAIWHLTSGSTLVQVMACRLEGAKPLPEPMLTYCQLDPHEKFCAGINVLKEKSTCDSVKYRNIMGHFLQGIFRRKSTMLYWITLNSGAQFSRSPSISVLTWRAPGPLGHPGRCVRCVRVRCHWPVWVAPVVCGSGWDDPRSPGTDGHEHSDCPGEKHTQWTLWLPWRETYTVSTLTALERNTHSEHSDCPGEKHTQWAHWQPWR